MDQKNQHQKNKFMVAIMQALHMRFDEFMYNLVHHSPYEIILYSWINKLYTQGKSSDDAIQLIYKARNIFLLTKNNMLCSQPNTIPKTSSRYRRTP